VEASGTESKSVLEATIMNAKIYVDNLATDTTETELTNLFSTYGNVVDVNIAVDGPERKSRGFGCVTMVTPEGARAAIQALNGRTVGTVPLALCEWQPNHSANSPNGRIPRRSNSKLY
jgi:RNA recognition motif-containing protein